MEKLSVSSIDRLLYVYQCKGLCWILPHSKPLIKRGLIEEDEPTGTYLITEKGIDYLKQLKLI